MKLNKNIFVVLLSFAFWITNAQTYNYYVSASTGNDTNNGNTWQTAYATITKALQQATAIGATYNIFLAQGEYTPDDMIRVTTASTKINLYGGYKVPTAESSPTSDPCLPGSKEKYPTIIKGAYNQRRGFFYVTSPSSSDNRGQILFNNITLQDINTSSVAGSSYSGIVTFAENSTNNDLYLQNVTINNWKSTATTSDAAMIQVRTNTQNTGIYIDGTVVTGGTFVSSGVGGGFIFVRQGAVNADVKITHSNFYSNTSGGTGGATSLITYNTAYDTDLGQSTIEITDTKFCNNSHTFANNNAPGMFEVKNIKSVTLKRNIFTSNVGGTAGIGYFNSIGELVSDRNTYYNNGAYNQGGVFSFYGSQPSGANYPLTYTFTNDIFYENVARGWGGALYSELTEGNFTIKNSLFLGNGVSDITDAGGGTHSVITDQGGAIYYNTGTFNIISDSSFRPNLYPHSTIFYQNDANHHGGAISTAGNAVLNIDTPDPIYFIQNTSKGTSGAMALGGTNTIKNVIFQDNSAVTTGGAIHNTGTTTIQNSFFKNNFANTTGGAIHSTNTVTVNNSFFRNNTAPSGGAVYSTSSYTSYNNVYNGNQSIGTSGNGVGGGAIRTTAALSSTYDIYMNNSTTATGTNAGGGAILFASGNYDITLDNNKFYKNSSSGYGGALTFVIGGGGTVNLTNLDFYQNSATTGGGAIAGFDDGDTGNEIDKMDNVKFYQNTVNGSATVAGADMYQAYAFSYAKSVNGITNSYMQNPNNTTYYTARGPLVNGGFGFGSGNTFSSTYALTAPTDEETNFTEISEPAKPNIQCGETVTLIPPTADIVADADTNASSITVCSTDTHAITFTAELGTAPYKFTYQLTTKVNGVATNTQTITTDYTSSPHNVSIPTGGTAGTVYEYVLKSVTDSTPLIDDDGNAYTGLTTNYTCVTPTATVTLKVCISNCVKPANTTGTGLETKHGITSLQRAGDINGDGDTTNDWPMIRKGAWTALEAKTKGFVITRVDNIPVDTTDEPGQVPTSIISTPQEGMIVYDIVNKCLKIYDGTKWSCFTEKVCN